MLKSKQAQSSQMVEGSWLAYMHLFMYLANQEDRGVHETCSGSPPSRQQSDRTRPLFTFLQREIKPKKKERNLCFKTKIIFACKTIASRKNIPETFLYLITAIKRKLRNKFQSMNEDLLPVLSINSACLNCKFLFLNDLQFTEQLDYLNPI